MATETLKTMTKAELVSLLQKRNAEINALRLELSIARLDAARGVKPHSSSAYGQRCAVARAQAISSGKATLVIRS